MRSPQVFGPYVTLVVFLIAAFAAVGREFWMARGLDKAYPLGRVSLAVPLAVFGAEHLTSAHEIMKLVPSWMPGKLFWTYFVGVALIAAALRICLEINYSELSNTRLDFVVPVAMEVVTADLHLGQFFVSDFDAGLIGFGIQLGMDLQSCLGGRRRD